MALAVTEADAAVVCQDTFVFAIERIDDCLQPARVGLCLMQIARKRRLESASTCPAGSEALTPGTAALARLICEPR